MEETDRCYYCCGKCQNLLSSLPELVKHKQNCIGAKLLDSSPRLYAYPSSCLLKFLLCCTNCQHKTDCPFINKEVPSARQLLQTPILPSALPGRPLLPKTDEYIKAAAIVKENITPEGSAQKSKKRKNEKSDTPSKKTKKDTVSDSVEKEPQPNGRDTRSQRAKKNTASDSVEKKPQPKGRDIQSKKAKNDTASDLVGKKPQSKGRDTPSKKAKKDIVSDSVEKEKEPQSNDNDSLLADEPEHSDGEMNDEPPVDSVDDTNIQISISNGLGVGDTNTEVSILKGVYGSIEERSQSVVKFDHSYGSKSSSASRSKRKRQSQQNHQQAERDPNDFRKYRKKVTVKGYDEATYYYVCDICSWKTEELNEFIPHRKAHPAPNGKDPLLYQCEYCPNTFNRKMDLDKHLMTHGGKPFKCPLCEGTFKTRKGLQRHDKAEHLGEKEECPIEGCKFRTVFQNQMTRHVERHKTPIGMEPFKCPHCPRKSLHRKTMDRHILTHVGEKKFKCAKCKYQALTKVEIKRHMFTHTQEKRFACDRCDYTSAYSTGLRNHMMGHLGMKPWQCVICGFNEMSRCKVLRHIRRKHKEQVPSDPNETVLRLGVKLDINIEDYRIRSSLTEASANHQANGNPEVQEKELAVEQIVKQIPSGERSKNDEDYSKTKEPKSPERLQFPDAVEYVTLEPSGCRSLLKNNQLPDGSQAERSGTQVCSDLSSEAVVKTRNLDIDMNVDLCEEVVST